LKYGRRLSLRSGPEKGKPHSSGFCRDPAAKALRPDNSGTGALKAFISCAIISYQEEEASLGIGREKHGKDHAAGNIQNL
jgi:hypothetical protein